MPIVTVTVRKPKSAEFKTQVLSAVHEALVGIVERLSAKDFDPENVMVVFQDVAWENGSPAGGAFPMRSIALPRCRAFAAARAIRGNRQSSRTAIARPRTSGGTDPMPASHIVRLESPHSFADTVRRLLAALDAKNIKVFATIDQQAEARAVGLAMPPTTLVMFGNPRAGTPLMLANPQAGVDLPLKVLVCESAPGQVAVYFTSAAALIRRHGLPPELEANLVAAERVVEAALGGGAGA